MNHTLIQLFSTNIFLKNSNNHEILLSNHMFERIMHASNFTNS